MNWLDLFGDEPQKETVDHSGANEDDCEETCPYVGILPDESEHEDGSPLDFGDAPGGNIGFRLVKRS